MKKFLEELANNKSHLTDNVPTKTESKQKKKELRNTYSKLVGRRALHISKLERTRRVVVIKEVNTHFIRVAYKYYGMDYEGEISVCICYLSLLCGDDRLDVE